MTTIKHSVVACVLEGKGWAIPPPWVRQGLYQGFLAAGRVRMRGRVRDEGCSRPISASKHRWSRGDALPSSLDLPHYSFPSLWEVLAKAHKSSANTLGCTTPVASVPASPCGNVLCRRRAPKSVATLHAVISSNSPKILCLTHEIKAAMSSHISGNTPCGRCMSTAQPSTQA